MKLYQTLKNLKELETDSLKKGYGGDATRSAIERHKLNFLNNIESLLSQLLKQTMRQNQILLKMKKKKNPSNWNLLVGEYLRQGKTIQEAAEDWKSKKKA